MQVSAVQSNIARHTSVLTFNQYCICRQSCTIAKPLKQTYCFITPTTITNERMCTKCNMLPGLRYAVKLTSHMCNSAQAMTIGHSPMVIALGCRLKRLPL